MALTDKKYSAVHNRTGSDKAKLETHFNDGHIHTLADLADNGHPEFGALIYQIQEMQEELDYLRTEISANKDKTGISSSQANAIVANTAKTSFPGFGTTNKTALVGNTELLQLGTTNKTALAGDTEIPPITVKLSSKTSLTLTTEIDDRNSRGALGIVVEDSGNRKTYVGTVALTLKR
tara:strand:- start:349 stop:882 length:534 start_codon:yes stop_codon:yes gene_type:complete